MECKIVAWARQHENIRAVLVVGSRGRIEARVDTWSDLDLVVFTSDPALYWRDISWLQEIGNCLCSAQKPAMHSSTTWLPVPAVWEDRLRVDFVFHAIPENCVFSSPLIEIITTSRYSYVFHPETRVLLDRLGAPGVLSPTGGEYHLILPAQPVFENQVKMYWLQAVYIAQLIQRGELWRAEQELHCELRRILLAFIEWHTLASKGADYKLSIRGRFLEEWADSRITSALNRELITGGRVSLQAELSKLCEMCQMIVDETAQLLGFASPFQQVKELDLWLSDLKQSDCSKHLYSLIQLQL